MVFPQYSLDIDSTLSQFNISTKKNPHNDLPLHNGDFPVRYELPKGNDDLGPYSPYYMRFWHAAMNYK